jgi:methyltransferase (TIGR00027 family)
MHKATPSKTAERVALRRAEHQIYDNPRVFEDPLALRIIGAEASAALAADPEEAQNPVAQRRRAFFAVRSRYAEDVLAASVRQGVRQCVILGAGLDTFAYRNPFSKLGLRVFEVDHPATQTSKRERLTTVGIAIPPELSYVPVDFEEQSVLIELEGNGFEPCRPTFFSWLGVTPYLTRAAFDATLGMISGLAAGSGVVFDFVADRRFLTPAEQIALSRVGSSVELAGEPFKLFFDPTKLVDDLRQLGFQHIECLDSKEMNQRYFANRSDRLRVFGGIGHLLSAR